MRYTEPGPVVHEYATRKPDGQLFRDGRESTIRELAERWGGDGIVYRRTVTTSGWEVADE